MHEPLRLIASVLFFYRFRVSANSVEGDVSKLIEDENKRSVAEQSRLIHVSRESLKRSIRF